MEPFLGEIRYFAMNFAPSGWAQCNGASMNIQQNAALYSLLGTQFGGNATTTFNLPDLRGRVPVGLGIRAIDNVSFNEGAQLGSETVALSATQVPAHTHQLYASSNTPVAGADNNNPSNNLTGHAATGTFPQVSGIGVGGLYNGAATATKAVTLHTNTVATSGSSAGHDNCAPSLVLMPCIAITNAIYPSRP